MRFVDIDEGGNFTSSRRGCHLSYSFLGVTSSASGYDLGRLTVTCCADATLSCLTTSLATRAFFDQSVISDSDETELTASLYSLRTRTIEQDSARRHASTGGSRFLEDWSRPEFVMDSFCLLWGRNWFAEVVESDGDRQRTATLRSAAKDFGMVHEAGEHLEIYFRRKC